MTGPARHDDLLRALERLDALLAVALERAEALFGPAAAENPHRGLYVTRDDAASTLARPPGATALHGGRRGAPGDDAPTLRRLASALELTALDEWLLLVALAPELDLRYERLFGYLQDDLTRRRPTLELALTLLCEDAPSKLAARSRLARSAPLRRLRVLELVPDPHQPRPPLLAHFLKLDDGVLAHLLGEDDLDPRLAAFCELVPGMPLDELVLAPPTLDALRRTPRPPVGLRLEGPAGSGKRAAAAALAARSGMPLLAARADAAPDDDPDVAALLVREARLRRAVLYLEEREDGSLGALAAAADDAVVGGTVERPSGRTIAFPPPSLGERRAAWRAGAARAGLPLAPDELDALASRFRLTPGEIEAAVADAASGGREPAAAARVRSRARLDGIARRIEPHYGWDDIVLPPEPLEQLRELCAHALHRDVVYDEWGFDAKLSLGQGLAALFAGASGTGKTMAAEVVASELGVDLYTIDLSQVVSKYIGETEKNLARVFDAARASSAVLFFDEADALFGKRSEVKDAHDRYANIEVAYLLQKLEQHDGVVVLATNVRQNVDEAFGRRLHHVIEFPFPEEEYRRQIWERLFPATAPLGADVDFALLARELHLAGGSIKNVALAAAFTAAADGGSITAEHLERAARREYRKLGRTWQETAWR